MTITERDRKILRAEVADKIEQLLPLTILGLDWRPVFEAQVITWRIKANGVQSQEDKREYLGWSHAHQFVLDEVQS